MKILVIGLLLLTSLPAASEKKAPAKSTQPAVSEKSRKKEPVSPPAPRPGGGRTIDPLRWPDREPGKPPPWVIIIER